MDVPFQKYTYFSFIQHCLSSASLNFHRDLCMENYVDAKETAEFMKCKQSPTGWTFENQGGLNTRAGVQDDQHPGVWAKPKLVYVSGSQAFGLLQLEVPFRLLPKA